MAIIPEQYWRFNVYEHGDTLMIMKVTYSIKRTLPGEQYDHETISAESVVQETEEPKTAQELLDEVMNLCRSNTLSAKLKKQKKTPGVSEPQS